MRDLVIKRLSEIMKNSLDYGGEGLFLDDGTDNGTVIKTVAKLKKLSDKLSDEELLELFEQNVDFLG
jgi:hypothetical protein